MQNKYPNEKTKRFHTPAYKKRVNAARRYKRRQTTVSTEESIARRKWLKGLPWALGAIAIIYLIYFAPSLRIRIININGADGTLQSQIQSTSTNFLKHYNHLLPEKNILFFSVSNFSKTISANSLVAKVQSVKKHYWHTIEIVIIQRVPAYVLKTPINAYVIANDGVVNGILAPTDALPAGLPIITDDTADTFQNAGQAISLNKINFIAAVQNNLQNMVQVAVQSYGVSSKDSNYLAVHTSSGYQILFNIESNAQDDLKHLQKILVQQPPNTHIAYIDLRFDPKVFVCTVGQPCATIPTTAVIPNTTITKP